MKFAIIGAGRWGSSLAWYLSTIKKYKVLIYGRHSERTEQFFKLRKNNYLSLPKEVETTFDITELNSCDYIILALNTQGLRPFLEGIKDKKLTLKKFIVCMKGIEVTSGLRITEILQSYGIKSDNISTFVGPCHIQNLQNNISTTMIIDSYNLTLSKELQAVLNSDLIKVEIGNDIVGTEIGAATKNIIGIGAGILIGLNKQNLIPTLKTHALAEVANIIKRAGGNPKSAYGIAHYGDYSATVDSPYSHNRMLGVEIAKNTHHNSANLTEGLFTVKALLKFLSRFNESIENYPLINEIYKATISLPYNIEKVLKNPLKI